MSDALKQLPAAAPIPPLARAPVTALPVPPAQRLAQRRAGRAGLWLKPPRRQRLDLGRAALLGLLASNTLPLLDLRLCCVGLPGARACERPSASIIPHKPMHLRSQRIKKPRVSPSLIYYVKVIAGNSTWSALHASRARMSARRRLSVGGSFSSRPDVTSLQWISRREKPHLQWQRHKVALTFKPVLLSYYA